MAGVAGRVFVCILHRTCVCSLQLQEDENLSLLVTGHHGVLPLLGLDSPALAQTQRSVVLEADSQSLGYKAFCCSTHLSSLSA